MIKNLAVKAALAVVILSQLAQPSFAAKLKIGFGIGGVAPVYGAPVYGGYYPAYGYNWAPTNYYGYGPSAYYGNGYSYSAGTTVITTPALPITGSVSLPVPSSMITDYTW